MNDRYFFVIRRNIIHIRRFERGYAFLDLGYIRTTFACRNAPKEA